MKNNFTLTLFLEVFLMYVTLIKFIIIIIILLCQLFTGTQHDISGLYDSSNISLSEVLSDGTSCINGVVINYLASRERSPGINSDQYHHMVYGTTWGKILRVQLQFVLPYFV